MTETNASFDLMVGIKFPRVNMAVLRPNHACLGELEIVGGGVLTLWEKM